MKTLRLSMEPAITRSNKRMPLPDSTAARWNLTLPSQAQSAGMARSFVRSLAEEVGYSSSEVDDIALAIGEAVANALEHGSPEQAASGENPIGVSVAVSPTWFSVRIRDHGPGFDPEAIRLSHPPPLLAERGRGFVLMQMLMDRVRVTRLTDGMEILLEKRLPNAPPVARLETAA